MNRVTHGGISRCFDAGNAQDFQPTLYIWKVARASDTRFRARIGDDTHWCLALLDANVTLRGGEAKRLEELVGPFASLIKVSKFKCLQPSTASTASTAGPGDIPDILHLSDLEVMVTQVTAPFLGKLATYQRNRRSDSISTTSTHSASTSTTSTSTSTASPLTTRVTKQPHAGRRLSGGSSSSSSSSSSSGSLSLGSFGSHAPGTREEPKETRKRQIDESVRELQQRVVAKRLKLNQDGGKPSLGQLPVGSTNYNGPVPTVAPNPLSVPVVATVATATPQKLNYEPISGLWQKAPASYTIKVRVTSMSAVKHWSNAGGSGYLVTVNLLDEEDAQIQATAFNADADLVQSTMLPEHMYLLNNFQVQTAKPEYSPNNGLCLTLSSRTMIRPLAEDGTIKKQIFSFSRVVDLERAEIKSIVDVIGLCTQIGPLDELTNRHTGNKSQKRVLLILDDTLASVQVTLWDALATAYDEQRLGGPGPPVVAFKALSVSGYGGRSLSSLRGQTQVYVEPNATPLTLQLRTWWDSGAGPRALKSDAHPMMVLTRIDKPGGGFCERKTLGAVQDIADAQGRTDVAGQDTGGRPPSDFIAVLATVTYTRYNPDKPPWYPACPDKKCGKKIGRATNGIHWYCQICNASHSKPQYRFILTVMLSDHTGTRWTTAFDQVAQTLLNGLTADALVDKVFLASMRVSCVARMCLIWSHGCVFCVYAIWAHVVYFLVVHRRGVGALFAGYVPYLSLSVTRLKRGSS